ncbi:DUF1631 family protein [Zoogloea sp.]|uniref:DUF1631 family protein n=1 Tax=Zoogloea sp. TaxID=49181 RepID=UPI00260283CD|nr:DUF1631 family protein [Zoogloea sp.]MDD3352380.1 DUF1631 family protein [Zoogloea sp.]
MRCRAVFLSALRAVLEQEVRHREWIGLLVSAAGARFDQAAGLLAPEALASPRRHPSVSVIHGADADFSAELLNLERRLGQFCGREQAALQIRLKGLLMDVGGDTAAAAAVSSGIVCHILRDLQEAEGLHPSEALDLLRRLEPALGVGLARFYRDFEHELALGDKGWLESAPSFPLAPPVPTAASFPALDWTDSPEALSSLPISPVEALRLAVLSRRESLPRSPGSLDPSLAAVLVERIEGWLGERRSHGSEGVSLVNSELGSLLSPDQAAAVEILEVVSAFALRPASGLSRPVREVIAGLRVPLLRLALRSEALLQARRHRVLAVIDRLADLGRQLAPDASPDLPVCRALRGVVEGLSQFRRVSDKDIEGACGQIEAILDARLQGALARGKALADQADRLERREVALIEASLEVQRLVAEEPVTLLREFVEGFWVHVLARVAYRRGVDSARWKESVALARQLLEAGRMPVGEAAGAALRKALPALFEGLKQGLLWLGLSESHVREGLRPCRAYLMALLAGEVPPAPLRRPVSGTSLGPVAGIPDFLFLCHKQHLPQASMPDPEWAEVGIGDPVAVGLPDGQVMRGFVALIGHQHQLILIADGDSPQVLAMTARALAACSRAPGTRVFRPASLVDAATTERLLHP